MLQRGAELAAAAYSNLKPPSARSAASGAELRCWRRWRQHLASATAAAAAAAGDWTAASAALECAPPGEEPAECLGLGIAHLQLELLCAGAPAAVMAAAAAVQAAAAELGPVGTADDAGGAPQRAATLLQLQAALLSALAHLSVGDARRAAAAMSPSLPEALLSAAAAAASDAEPLGGPPLALALAPPPALFALAALTAAATQSHAANNKPQVCLCLPPLPVPAYTAPTTLGLAVHLRMQFLSTNHVAKSLRGAVCVCAGA